MHLIPIANETILKQFGIYYRQSTLRKWFATGVQPALFKKIRGRIFVDAAAWQKFLEYETGSQN